MGDKALELTTDMAMDLRPEKRGNARAWQAMSRFVWKKPLGAIGALLLLAFIAVAISAP